MASKAEGSFTSTAPELEASDAAPPAYSDQTPSTNMRPTLSTSAESSDDRNPPAYNEAENLAPDEAKESPTPGPSVLRPRDVTVSLHCPFPSTMNAHGSWTLQGLKSFFICGATAAERLFLVETAHGMNSKPPLGTRYGCLLRNGTSMKDPVFAAAGENKTAEMSSRSSYTNTSSVIITPDRYGNYVSEIMAPVMSADKEIAFRFSTDLNLRKSHNVRREQFEWVKFKKGEDSEHTNGGYKLFRRSAQDAEEAGPSEASSSSSGPSTRREPDVLAVLIWPRGLITFRISYFFTLMLTKVAEVELAWSDQWRLMVVMTALRLTYLRAIGGTTKTIVGLHAEKE